MQKTYSVPIARPAHASVSIEMHPEAGMREQLQLRCDEFAALVAAHDHATTLLGHRPDDASAVVLQFWFGSEWFFEMFHTLHYPRFRERVLPLITDEAPQVVVVTA